MIASNVKKTVPQEGHFFVRVARDMEDVSESITQQDADFLLVGLLLPTQHVQELRQIIADSNGSLSSPVYLLKSFSPSSDPDNASISNDLKTSNRSPHQPNRTKSAIKINSERHEILVDDQAVELTATEFRLLQLFVEHPGWVLSRDQIIEHIRGKNYACTPRSVDVLIVSLRRKLKEHGKTIQTVRGVGYRYREQSLPHPHTR